MRDFIEVPLALGPAEAGAAQRNSASAGLTSFRPRAAAAGISSGEQCWTPAYPKQVRLGDELSLLAAIRLMRAKIQPWVAVRASSNPAIITACR